ncbi:[FeFe] hydrogenase maturase subunit HydE [bioreactor metagenome]|uniref:biotin synthase n=1 Tax=bioreactor metagenome TaxID=1076179 RepID=A0A644SUC4_9ZZZZ|nr:5,10-methenyltetrahydromethanopterin hydrogenase cofactor biosynthesis protein HmdB [Methanobrevibacter sp.]MEA4956353.1 5,10-methenyltetrahydromethanopterin hydrogenase cofactor biosynthesis protein HmdB [Methanobrevibacter sp.]
MIDKILKKVHRREDLTREEILELFKIEDEKELEKLMNVASYIRDCENNQIKLTSTIHMTNICKVKPKCKYCGFATKTSSEGYYHGFYKKDSEILEAAKCVADSEIPRISCSGAHGYDGKHAVVATKIVKENTPLELLVNVGSDLNREAIKDLARYNVDTVCCNLETVNEELFNEVKPGEKLQDRVEICEMICEEGIELSSGLLIGLGESYEDRIDHLLFLKKFNTLGEIPIMGFNPYKDTPMENHPPCSIREQMKTIAITRILFPKIRITVPTPTIGPENVEYSLKAGANNLATVIPKNYPTDVKGVGSPTYGNLEDVLNILNKLGLKLECN